MKLLNLQVRLCGGFLPEWKSHDDSGLDLRASEDIVILAYTTKVVRLGIVTAFAPMYTGIIKDRSGIASKHGVFTHAGVIDSSYRGEWGVVMENSSEDPYKVSRGDRICQVLFLPCFHLQIEEVTELPTSFRDGGGFGSTGLK